MFQLLGDKGTFVTLPPRAVPRLRQAPVTLYANKKIIEYETHIYISIIFDYYPDRLWTRK